MRGLFERIRCRSGPISRKEKNGTAPTVFVSACELKQAVGLSSGAERKREKDLPKPGSNRFVFPQKHRLPANQISRALASKRRFHSPHFVLLVIVAKASTPFQIAILVPGKLDKRAVVRNRLRRALREMILKRQGELVGGNQAVILVKAKFLPQERARVGQEIISLFSRGGLFKTA